MPVTPSYVQDAAADVVKEAGTEIGTTTAREVRDGAGSLVFTPSDLAAELITAIQEVGTLAELEELAESGLGELAAVPQTTSNRKRQATNQAALVDLVRGIATVELGRRAARETYSDRTSAIEQRDRVGDRLDERGRNADTDTFTALRELRAAVSAHVTEVVTDLPQVVEAAPATILPSLALAYAIHGDVDRAGEIAARNRLPRPGFVPARPIQVVRL